MALPRRLPGSVGQLYDVGDRLFYFGWGAVPGRQWKPGTFGMPVKPAASGVSARPWATRAEKFHGLQVCYKFNSCSGLFGADLTLF
ncbi:MAG: hypothetical protein LCH89_12655 [Proteobacteria bacterium]|nr:hypothetical protein [Pseudomonadota bacterium]